jgi:hypothetical protein
MKPITVRPDQWERIIDAARIKAGDPNLPMWSALVNYYSVCIPSLVTPLSMKLWFLYQRIQGTTNETYESYNNLPAFWVDACAVIERETARIDKVRSDKAKQQQASMLRMMGRNRYGNK